MGRMWEDYERDMGERYKEDIRGYGKDMEGLWERYGRKLGRVGKMWEEYGSNVRDVREGK